MKKLILLLLFCFYFLSSTVYADDFPAYVIDIAWHPDGTKIALSIARGQGCGPIESLDDIRIVIVSYPSLETLYTIKPLRACTIDALEWSSDGQYLLLGETDYNAYIWELSTQKIISTSESFFSSQQRYMDHIVPGGTIVANTTFSNGLMLWDLKTGGPILNVPDSENAYGVSWNPDGSKLVFGSGGKPTTCSILETTDYQVISTFNCMADNPLWSPDGQWILTSIPGREYLWNATTLTLERNSYDKHQGSYNTKWSPDSQYLADVHGDQTLVVTRISDGSEIYSYSLPYPTTTFAWSPDGNIIVYGDKVTVDNPLGIGLINRSTFDSSGLATPTLSKNK